MSPQTSLTYDCSKVRLHLRQFDDIGAILNALGASIGSRAASTKDQNRFQIFPNFQKNISYTLHRYLRST
jgi:hypothetical protein